MENGGGGEFAKYESWEELPLLLINLLRVVVVNIKENYRNL